MSIQAQAWAYEQKIGDCAAKFVLIALADIADREGFIIWNQTAWDRTLEITDLDLHELDRSLALLIEKRLISSEHGFLAEGFSLAMRV